MVDTGNSMHQRPVWTSRWSLLMSGWSQDWLFLNVDIKYFSPSTKIYWREVDPILHCRWQRECGLKWVVHSVTGVPHSPWSCSSGCLRLKVLDRQILCRWSYSHLKYKCRYKYCADNVTQFSLANHANFFSRFSHPLLSRKVAEWREQSTVRKKNYSVKDLMNHLLHDLLKVREKQEMFKPLERHIAQELAVQQVFCMHLIIQLKTNVTYLLLLRWWSPFVNHCFQLDLRTSGIHGDSGKRQELETPFSSFLVQSSMLTLPTSDLQSILL